MPQPNQQDGPSGAVRIEIRSHKFANLILQFDASDALRVGAKAVLMDAVGGEGGNEDDFNPE
jgi:hypothetical protein